MIGPPGSGKTARLLEQYRIALRESRPGAVVWLSPTWRVASDLRGRLLGGVMDGCFSPGVMTFAQLGETILQSAAEPVRPISRLVKRHLLRQLIDDQVAQGRLKHFGPIAATSGLLDSVCDFIRELKRLEVWPEDFGRACRSRGFSQKDGELLAIYEAYQQCLLQHHLYDAEGRSWLARDWLRKIQWPNLRMVVADGFTDFTRTEHEILDILASRATESWITLPLEPEPRRSDLFDKPLKTLAELRRRHSGMRVEELERPEQPSWPAMAHLERMLFVNPRQTRPATATTGLEIVVAGRQLGELQWIAARIKRLLIEGDSSLGGRPVRPGEIAVVFRHSQASGDLVNEVFGRLGIPFALEAKRPLGRFPAMVMLASLLQLDADDWPVGDLLNVLGNNYFCPDWPQWRGGTMAAACERVIRRLQVVRGRKRLLEQLQSADAAPEDEAVLGVLQRLAAALDELPERAGLAQWARAWKRLADQTGLLRAMRDDEKPVWQQFDAALQESWRLTEWLGQEATELDRRQALAGLIDILGNQPVGRTNDESGRVRVLSAIGVRQLRVPYLFVAGLCEKSFPSPDREDRLYGEAEHQRLIDEGLPLPTRADRQNDEMLLFYEAITSTTRRLWLSYPAVDESGEPLSPSPYLAAVERACGRGLIRRTEQLDLSPVPGDDALVWADAFRLRAVFTAMKDGNVDLLAGFLRHAGAAADGMLAGLDLLSLRQDRNRFGPAEGMLSQAVRHRLASEFSRQRTFSATELEAYAYCPYRFFIERLLKLEPVEDPVLEIDYRQRGLLAHEFLASLHRRVNQYCGTPSSPATLEPDTYQRLLAETLEEVAGSDTADSLQGAMREVNRRTLLQWINAYRVQHEKYDALWRECDVAPRPELFEVSFGRPLREGDGPPSTEMTLELNYQDDAVLLSGRIDRIDTGNAGGHAIFNVLDYKTGGSTRFSPEAVARGTVLQLPVYALAVTELILNDRDAVPWQAGYWYIGSDGFKPRQALKMYHVAEGGLEPSDTWEVIRAMLAKTIVGLVQGMRAGQFPVWSADPDCTGRCPFSTVCRINQIRSLEKTWQPPVP